MNEIIINVYNDEVNVGVEEIIETVTIVITENAGIQSEAPIETASANGVPIPIVNKNIDIIIPTKTSDLTNDSDFVSDANYVHTDNNYDNAAALEVAKIVEKANSSDVYTKSETYTQTEINNKLSAVYEFKGSVLTYAELPTDAENADVYNVEENGVNYAWVEATSSWDSLGGIVGLATLTENGLLSKEDFAKLQNLSGTNTGDETQDSLGEKIELTELTEITDTTKIAASDSAFLKWFSGLRIKNYLTGFFAKLSGGNIFSGKQDFDGMINHKAGEYFYTAASKTADTVNDTRVINSAGVEIHSVCTGNGATKGGGTWQITYVIDGVNQRFGLRSNPLCRFDINVNSSTSPTLGSPPITTAIFIKDESEAWGMFAGIDSGTGEGWFQQMRRDSPVAYDLLLQPVGGRVLIGGDLNTKVGKYKFNAASPTADTINDTRTVNTSGLLELFKCSLGNVTKGLGTWIYGRLKLGMVIETEINEYADNAAALAAGLTAGMKYRTGDLYKIVH